MENGSGNGKKVTTARIITAAVFYILIAVLTFLMRKTQFASEDMQIKIGFFSDLFALPGLFFLIVAFFGSVDFPGIDIFVYAHKKTRAMITKKAGETVPKTFYEYRKSKPVYDRSWTFLWYVVGAVSLIIGLMFLAVYSFAF